MQTDQSMMISLDSSDFSSSQEMLFQDLLANRKGQNPMASTPPEMSPIHENDGENPLEALIRLNPDSESFLSSLAMDMAEIPMTLGELPSILLLL